MLRLRLALSVPIVLLLLLAQPWGVPSVAAAAPPWRFLPPTHGYGQVPPLGEETLAAECADGYLPVSGGVTSGYRTLERVFEYRGQGDYWRNYYVRVRNLSETETVTVRISAECVDASAIAYEAIASRDVDASNGYAAGTATCESGWRAISGGADWNISDSRRTIDRSGPTRDGTGWEAVGRTSDPRNSLHIEVYCLPPSDLQGAQMVRNGTGPNNVTSDSLTVWCPDGSRVLNGGMPFDGTHGLVSTASGPFTTSWTVSFRKARGTPSEVVAWCVPASRPTVTITQAPPAFTNSTSSAFAFAATDPAGEQMTYRCSVDDQTVSPCQPGTPIPTTVTEGVHSFRAVAQNASRGYSEESRSWTVDLTRPRVAARAPTSAAPLTGGFTVTFSEPVLRVGPSTFRVFVAGSTSPLAGSITVASSRTRATWTPAAPLVPGQTYEARVGSGITDRAGNALTPTSWRVRATTTVDSTSPVLRETWDADTHASASGGSYRESRQSGARATFRFAGADVRLVGTLGPDGGLADIYLDGVRLRTVSFYSSTRQWQRVVFARTGLATGRAHTLEVRVLGTRAPGSSAAWIRLDAFRAGTRLHEESSSAVRYQFTRSAASTAFGGSFDRVLHQTSGDTGPRPAYTLTFRGPGVRLIATLGPSFGLARILIDGTVRATVDLRARYEAYQAVVYVSPALADAVHTLRVEPVGTSSGANSEINVDAVRVT